MSLENKSQTADQRSKRKLILVSGYYGFANLGDEAILETITDELKKAGLGDQTVVLSNNPRQTEEIFGVRAVDRWKLASLIKLLPRTRLLISGGGGLFQDAVSIRSPIFYGSQIMLARMLGAKAMIFAQGIGPIKTGMGKAVTRGAFALCDVISVRDVDSQALLREWNLDGWLTADPVWALKAKSLPEKLETWRAQRTNPGMRVGLSLRVSNNFPRQRVLDLADCMNEALPADACVVPLSLQPAQDDEYLAVFAERWRSFNRQVEVVDTTQLKQPSQWISLLSGMDLNVAMRLHCGIMGLISAVPTVPIAYDPKVSKIAKEFELPTLNLTKEGEPLGGSQSWLQALKTAVREQEKIAARAGQYAEAARNLACQNFDLLARILE